ncbi:MAG TPA: class I SAM-dependent methyltransferase, partial [Pyrinomonadaceae bacterium]|nr:class I SAM-dependent methyltransferase [Pyrinomonadaceae bacterium]
LYREFAETIAADPVAEFYTDHPYPPPVENLDRARDEWRDENRLRAEYHLVWPNRAYRDDLNILVAGCGTWQAAKYALCRPCARVTGIDVSTTSLEHTEKLKQKYRLTNLETERLPIERAAELGRRFDLVICTGVLHHLADPGAGLAALRSVLAPDGAIYLMVYAPYGRAGVYLLQEYCRRLGIGTSSQEINDLATVVDALSPHHPLASLLRSSRDALNPDALADALLNPRDRAYSVPQLFDLIERNGLEFGRWYWQAPYLPQCGSIAATPHAKRLAELPERELYAAMELWRGTMTAHSIVVHASAPGTRGRQFSFADDRWLNYVPHRLPNTLCVTERLPRGAAGVLLNRSHPFHDLIVIVDPAEKRLFDAIDGSRNLADIVDHAGGDAFRARGFLKKLWEYDQIVFDTSKA